MKPKHYIRVHRMGFYAIPEIVSKSFKYNNTYKLANFRARLLRIQTQYKYYGPAHDNVMYVYKTIRYNNNYILGRLLHTVGI